MRALRVGMAVAVLACAGCLWRGYSRVMEIHVEVLDSMATQLCDMAHAGVAPAAEDMGQYVYPAERARQFSKYFAADAKRSSYVLFGQLVDRYESEVHLVDRARTDAPTWKQRGTEVCAATTGVLDAARLVRRALKEESEH